MESPQFVEFMEKGGFGMGYMSGDALAKFMVQQTAQFKPLLEEAGLAKK
jgi:tripartite-type tricarboxylate transporter receptor subunit TctC